MSNLTSTHLRRALQLQERIEELQGELNRIMGGTMLPVTGKISKGRTLETTFSSSRGMVRRGHPPGGRRRKPHPLKGKKRPASPSGPLAPAVMAVLKKAGRPLPINDILKGLSAAKYQWTCADPKKNLYARIYRLKGVRRVSEGVFGLA